MDARITIARTRYNTDQMTDTNSLSKALLMYPSLLSPVMTHLGGREDEKFPLSFMTEGLGNTKSIESLEYEYPVVTRISQTREIAVTPANTTNLGQGGAIFYLTFPDKWFIPQYVLISKSGVQIRIMGAPIPNGTNYDYPVRLTTPEESVVMPADDVTAGSKFGQMFAPVGVDWSRGNASNWTTPGKVRNKLTTIRKSYQFSGNVKDQVVQISLPTDNGTTNLWMDFEEWQYYLQWKEESELYYWYADQSYNEQGVTQMKDENNQPVVIGPGLLRQIPNKDTYSELTVEKLDNIVGDLFYGMTGAQQRQITLYTGTGGKREFDRAIKEKVGNMGYLILDQGKFVNGQGSNLSLDGYFTSYKHVDGHTINVVKVPLFDHGVVAQTRDPHPRTGYSLESYRLVFVDQSNYDGENNLMLVNKKNRELLKWYVAGSTVPRGYPETPSRASDIDGASVHYLKTAGICLRRFDTSFDVQCVAS